MYHISLYAEILKADPDIHENTSNRLKKCRIKT
jgi:hypothetical protein